MVLIYRNTLNYIHGGNREKDGKWICFSNKMRIFAPKFNNKKCHNYVTTRIKNIQTVFSAGSDG